MIKNILNMPLKIAFIYLIVFWFGWTIPSLITGCTGSEIGNPADASDGELVNNDTLFISAEESALLNLIGRRLTVETLRKYQGDIVFDSMVIKAFNHHYYDKDAMK
jgi:hypothetical protein